MTRNQAMRRDDMVGGRNGESDRHGREDSWSGDGYDLRPGYHYGQQADAEPEYDPRAYAPNPEEPYGYDDDGRPIYYEPEPRKLKSGRGGLMMVGAVIAVALVGGAGAVGYKMMGPGGLSGEPPLIRADTEPVKTLPKSSGEETPVQNKAVYDRVDPTAGPKSKVVSREEEPVDLPSAPSGDARNGESSRVILPGGTASAEPVAPGTNGSEPRRVKTVAIRPNEPGPQSAQSNDSVLSGDGPQLRTDEASLASIQNPQRAPAARPQPQPAPAAATRNVVTTPVRPTPAPVPRTDPAQVAAVSPRAPAPTPTATTAPAAGGFVVQVTSQRSEADARAAYVNLQKKFPGVLGPYKASIATAAVADRGTYYRVRVGPFANAMDANKVCGNLRSAGGECVVSRNN